MASIGKKEEFTFADVLLLPGKSKIEMDEEGDIDLTTNLTKKIKLDIPIVSANMSGVTESEMAIAMAKMGGIGIIHQFMPKERQLEEVRKVKEDNLLVGAALSYGEGVLKHAKVLEKLGCDLIVVDSANAHNLKVIDLVKKLKKKTKCQIVAGNIASKKAAKDLIKAGVDGLKVGIGPGSHCTTRIVTGFGRPQLSTIIECAKEAKKKGLPVIADGGIEASGDIVKALALGADTVMIGGLLVGTDQSPGRVIRKDGEYYKKTLGNCTEEVSHFTRQRRVFVSWGKAFLKKLLYGQKMPSDKKTPFIEEGVGGLVKYKGDAEKIVSQLAGGIRRGFWYGGASNLSDLQKTAKFIRVSAASLQENEPRI